MLSQLTLRNHVVALKRHSRKNNWKTEIKTSSMPLVEQIVYIYIYIL